MKRASTKSVLSVVRPTSKARVFAQAVVILLGVALPALAWAQAEVRTSVHPRSVEVGGYLNFTLTVHVESNRPIRVLGAPDFGDGLQVTGSSRSPSYVVRNGQAMQTLTHAYRLRATRAGEHTIRPPKVRVDGKTVEPDEATVQVHARGRAPKSRRDSHGRPQRFDRQRDQRDERVFVDHTLEPTSKPYVGEQVTLAYYLYADAFRLKVNPEPPSEPSLDDFWIEDLSEEFSGRRQSLRIHGKVMERANLRAYALFPLRAGTTRIEPLEVDVHVGGFMRRSTKTRLASDPVELDVQPLPPNAPDSFYEGNVGQWRFQVTTNRTQAKMGRPVTLRVSAFGDGQLGRLSLPALPSIEGARIAGTRDESTRKIRNGVIGGEKTVEYTLVPEREGALVVPSLEFSYFDPEREVYDTIRTEPIEIEVRGGTLRLDHQSAPKAHPDETREETAVLDTLVSKLAAPRAAVRPPSKAPLERSPILWILLALPTLGVLAIWLLRPVRAFLTRPKQSRRGSGYKPALSELASAKDRPAGEALEGVRRALKIYLTEQAGLAPGDVSEAKLAGALERRGVDSDLAARLGDLLRRLNEARYSPDKAAVASQADELRKECKACLEALEKSRRAKSWTASTASLLLAICVAGAGFLAPLPVHAEQPADVAKQSHESPNKEPSAETLEQAVEAQQNKQWHEAAVLWKQLAETQPHSPDILYNLGTALAHAGDYGQARLAFERGALHAPGDQAMEKNRDLIQQIVHLRQIELARGTVRENTTSEGLFWWRLATSVSSHWLLVLLTVCAWLIFFASLARKFAKNGAVREAALLVGGIFALLMVLTVSVWLARGQILTSVEPAVIVAEESLLREGPSEHAALAGIDTILIPGVLMAVEDTRDGWVKLAFADGTSAWTRRENLAFVE